MCISNFKYVCQGELRSIQNEGEGTKKETKKEPYAFCGNKFLLANQNLLVTNTNVAHALFGTNFVEKISIYYFVKLKSDFEKVLLPLEKSFCYRFVKVFPSYTEVMRIRIFIDALSEDNIVRLLTETFLIRE